MLMKLDPVSTQAKRLAANIYRAVRRMSELLADLAAENFGKTSTLEICKIQDVIAAASAEALRATQNQNIQILTDVPGDLDLPLDRSRLDHLFFSLITNALEAMPHGGTVRIGASKADNCVRITLEDTEPVIPHGIRDRLFEPFVTTGREWGLALGLALSRQTLLALGGDMWTEPGSGARFVIRLPLKVASNETF
jgi:signal transduction histidine kinase